MAATRTARRAGPAPSDDEILGIGSADSAEAASPDGESGGAADQAGLGGEAAVKPAEKNGPAEPEELRALFEANPELRRAWRDERAYRESFPSPEEARAARQQLAELDQLDALFFSRHPDAHTQIAEAVYRLDPEAFRGLARAMNRALERMEARGLSAEAQPRATPARQGGPAPEEARSAEAAATKTGAESPGPPAAFLEEANAAAVEGVLEAVEAQVDRLLPEGTPAGARNRVVGEIYRELETSLRTNRQFARQLRQAVRGGAYDAGHQSALATLIVGRARQALPGVAKKVIQEWTSSVLAADRDRRARQRAAASRVDITGHATPGTAPRRPVSPRDIDYARLSDNDILNM